MEEKYFLCANKAKKWLKNLPPEPKSWWRKLLVDYPKKYRKVRLTRHIAGLYFYKGVAIDPNLIVP